LAKRCVLNPVIPDGGYCWVLETFCPVGKRFLNLDRAQLDLWGKSGRFGSEGTFDNGPALSVPGTQRNKPFVPAGRLNGSVVFNRPCGTSARPAHSRRRDAGLFSRSPFGTKHNGRSQNCGWKNFELVKIQPRAGMGEHLQPIIVLGIRHLLLCHFPFSVVRSQSPNPDCYQQYRKPGLRGDIVLCTRIPTRKFQ